MSGRSVNQHHKTRTESCKGVIRNNDGQRIEKETLNQKWVYWCPKVMNWLTQPCNCKL